APTHFSTLPLHDALPSSVASASKAAAEVKDIVTTTHHDLSNALRSGKPAPTFLALESVVTRLTDKVDELWMAQYAVVQLDRWSRSEEHTSELQSREKLVC